MRVDYHTHTSFSHDSKTTPEEMIQAAIQKGLTSICITDHHDEDFTEPGFEIDFETYFPTLKELQEKYKNQIKVRIGMEFGFQTHVNDALAAIVSKYPFDFVIGSMHLIDGIDPYYKVYFHDKTDTEGYRRFFEVTLENIRLTDDYDVLGHIDYVVRHGKYQAKEYSYVKYGDYIDAILKHLIEHGKGLEINTGGWKYGLDFAHPHPDVLRRYKELGGEIITVGSDAHNTGHLAYDFHRVNDLLTSCGFKYYTEFEERKPVFCALI